MASLDDVLDALTALLDETGRPVATAPEIEERLDQSRRKTLDDLRLLERAGDVESHDVGANATVWWPASGRGDVTTASDVAPADDTPGVDASGTTSERPNHTADARNRSQNEPTNSESSPYDPSEEF